MIVVRLIVLAAMGLGSLYMLHILAMDFNRIRKPVANLAKLLIFKRDVNAVAKMSIDSATDDIEIDWNRIQNNDPLNCAMSLICQIVAGAGTNNDEAKNIKALVQYSVTISKSAPIEITKAYAQGQKNMNKAAKCYQQYPFCPYSAKTMLNILDVFTHIFNNTQTQNV